MRRLIAATVGAVVVGISAPTAALAAEEDWRIAAQAEIDAYMAKYPDDFTGIDELLVKYGLPPMKVSVSGVAGELTGAAAERILDARERQQRALPTAPASEGGASELWPFP